MGQRIQRLALADLKQTLLKLGFVGENEHTSIVIDCSEIYSDYPNATVMMAVQSPHDDLYPGTVIKDGNDLEWNVVDNDLVYPGTGQIQLTFYNGQEVIKSYVGRTWIDESITATGDPPDPLADWLQTAVQTEERMAEATFAIDEMTVEAEAGDTVDAEISTVAGRKHIKFTVPSAYTQAIAGDDYEIRV